MSHACCCWMISAGLSCWIIIDASTVMFVMHSTVHQNAMTLTLLGSNQAKVLIPAIVTLVTFPKCFIQNDMSSSAHCFN